MSDSLPQRFASKWILIGLAGLVVGAFLIFGRRSQPPVEIEGPSARTTQESCETRLASAFDQARPDSLGLVGTEVALRNTPDDAAASFSEWLARSDCRDAVPTEPISAKGRELIARLLGEKGVERLTVERFTEFDAAHVRNALIDFAAAQDIAKERSDDLARVMRVFEYVTRIVSLQGESSVNVPVTTYEARLFGRGSAEDRALLFSNLLRQLRIDAVILRPAGEGDGGPWWVGVPQKDGTLLFDTELGVPVPAPDAPPPAAPAYLPKPATWAQAAANPDLLVAYRRGTGLTAEPIPADRLKSPRVELIGPASYWKSAMERLELSLPGERGVLLYDPLQDTQSQPGLYRRISDAGLSGAIAVWPYPDKLEAERASLSEAQRRRLGQRIAPFLGPVQIDTKTDQVKADKRLWATRIAHMSGRPEPAIPSYLGIRKLGIRKAEQETDPRLTPADHDLNRLSADEADYWIAQAQFDLGEYTAAATTARVYIDRGGSRSDESAALIALALAAQGKTAEAAGQAAKVPDTSPAAPRMKWLAARWKAAPAN